MLILENKDLPGFSLFLGEQSIEYWQAFSRGLLGQQSTLCCSGLRYTLRYTASADPQIFIRQYERHSHAAPALPARFPGVEHRQSAQAMRVK